MADALVDQALMDRFIAAFTNDGTDMLLEMVAPDCEWVVMPSGESFRGPAQIADLFAKIAAARSHSPESSMSVTHRLRAEGGFCFEIINRGVITGGFAGVEGGADGAFEMNFCVTVYVGEGRVTAVREYFDLGQLSTPPSARPKLFA